MYSLTVVSLIYALLDCLLTKTSPINGGCVQVIFTWRELVSSRTTEASVISWGTNKTKPQIRHVEQPMSGANFRWSICLPNLFLIAAFWCLIWQLYALLMVWQPSQEKRLKENCNLSLHVHMTWEKLPSGVEPAYAKTGESFALNTLVKTAVYSVFGFKLSQ